MIERYTLLPVPLNAVSGFTRADLEFYGINHFRPSYHARVFFNDPEVTVDNADAARSSYAGSFSIFGHQTCSGSEGHCEVHEHLRRFDDRPSHPLTRAFKRVIVTDALHLIDHDDLTITLIVSTDPKVEPSFDGPLFDFTGAQIATFK